MADEFDYASIVADPNLMDPEYDISKKPDSNSSGVNSVPYSPVYRAIMLSFPFV